MAHVLLIRHGLSDYNKKGLWTGWTDVPLTEEGREQARATAQQLKDLSVDKAYTSDLLRTKQTYQEIADILNLEIEVIEAPELKERNYGVFTGKNKWEVKDSVGEEEFQKIRRSWDHPIPKGETMEAVYQRVVPYYEQVILPELRQDKTIMIVSSGNSLRALVMYLEDLTHEQLASLEIGVGEVYDYTLDTDSKVVQKQIRAKNEQAGKI